jgi:hypothetical protein
MAGEVIRQPARTLACQSRERKRLGLGERQKLFE